MKALKNVYVVDPESGRRVRVAAGDEIPGWAAKLITNPKVTGADASADVPETELSDLTVRELRQLADERGVDLGGATTKADILDALAAD